MEVSMKELEKLYDIDKRYRIFGMIFLLSNKLETIGNSFLGELTTKQWFFMLTLTTFFESPPTLSQLAKQMGTSHQNLKQLAIRLQEKGFLTIEKDQLDNRALRIFPTKKMEEYVRVRQDKDHKFIEDFFRVLKDREIKELDETLFRLMDSIQNIEEELS
jgi:DNA-binding MarR family transcriptional regulator